MPLRLLRMLSASASSAMPKGMALLAVCTLACSRPGDADRPAPGAGADQARARQTVQLWRRQLDTLAGRVRTLDSAVRVVGDSQTLERARRAFVDARVAYKQVELALEYYTPSTARAMNGPALPEVEETEGPEAVSPPTGFQVIEELLYGDDPTAEGEALARETATLHELVTRAQTMMGAQESTDDRVWDAAKLELARVVTLGITGFDSPVAGLSLVEASAALEGVQQSLAQYRTAETAWQQLDSAFEATRRPLRDATTREQFDHFGFIVDRANPLGRAMRAARESAGIGTPAERRAFRMEAATVFDSGAFDVMAFAPLDAREATSAQVALGKRLFHDVRLSGDGRRSCASCHAPERAFADGLRVNRARGGTPLARNTPTVINSGAQMGVFADLRTTYLEDQVTDVVENVDEMHGSLESTAAVLARDSALVAQFRQAFVAPTGGQPQVPTAATIRSALAAYQRSLTRLNSPVDLALRGNTGALSDSARRGFNVFVGKGKCATCHFLPLTNGTVPPMFQKSEVEVLGTPSRAVTANATVDSDEGRYRLTRAAPHRYAFRTPSLRNVALTAPYMHNGVYATLESVIDFYDRGGGAGIGVRLDNQTLPPDRLRLSPTEKRELVVFLRALTDTSAIER